MVLQVEFEDFATELKERFGRQVAYIAETRQGCQLTAGDPGTELILFARTNLPESAVRKRFGEQEIEVRNGAWIGEEQLALTANFLDVHVAAIAYQSEELRPGLWVEAFASEPSHHDVISRFYQELRNDGHLKNIDLDDFWKRSQANIVVLNPDQIRKFAEENAEPIGELSEE